MTWAGDRGRLLAALLLVAAGAALVMVFDIGRVLGNDGALRFWDQDSYTRLLRLRALLDGAGWHDDTLAAINAPLGLSMHWTRPLDMLLAPAAALLSPWLGQTRALEMSAALIGPLLAVPSLLVLWSALPAGTDRRVLLLSGALFVLQRPVAYRFAFGQGDHHHLIVLLHLACLAPLLRIPGHPAPTRMALVAGGAAAFGLWVTPGGVITLAVALLALGVGWLYNGDAGALRRFADGLLAGAMLALVVERPLGQWLIVEYDRFSVVHLGLAVAVFAGALVLQAGAARVRGSIAARALLAVLAATLTGGMLLAVFPHLAGSPMLLVDAGLARSLEQGISELRPSLPASLAAVPEFVLDMAPALAALLWVALRVPGTSGAEHERAVMETLMLVILMVAAMYLTRAQELLLALAPLAWAQAMVAQLDRATGACRQGALVAATGASVLVLALVSTTWVSGYAWAGMGGWDLRKPPGCEYERVAPYIAAATAPRQTVLADINAGPEVAWRTRRGVLAALYHRNVAGVRDASTVYLSTGDDAAARTVVAQRRIGALVFCRRLSSQDAATLRAAPQILFSRVQTARAPAWLQPVPLPAALAGQFALFRVAGVP